MGKRLSELFPVDLTRYATLDLDNYSCDELRDTVVKILRLDCSEIVCCKPSSNKGFHVMIWCRRVGCDLCRLVFDDQVRYQRDFERTFISRNVLFDCKEQLFQR